jgi:hypothetical protein
MPRSAYTLLEVVAASALTGTVLVSSLALLRDAVALSDRIDHQNLLNTFCVSKLEEHLNLTAASFTTADVSGNFVSSGFSDIRFRAVRSDSGADGGISNRLMSLSVTVWHDTNGDGALTAGEQSVTLATKVAKMSLYESEAS